MKYLIVATIFLIGSLPVAQNFDIKQEDLWKPDYVDPKATIEINPWEIPARESTQLLYNELRADEFYNEFQVGIQRDPVAKILDYVDKNRTKYLNDKEFINTIAAPSIQEDLNGERIDLNNQILNRWSAGNIGDEELLRQLQNPKENRQRRLQNIYDDIAAMQEAKRNNAATPIKRDFNDVEYKFIEPRGFFRRIFKGIGKVLKKIIKAIKKICINNWCISFQG